MNALKKINPRRLTMTTPNQEAKKPKPRIQRIAEALMVLALAGIFSFASVCLPTPTTSTRSAPR